MKKRSNLFGIYLPIFISALISTTVMRTVALMNDFNAETGFFADKILITVSDYVVIGASLFFFTYVFTARKNIKLIPDFASPISYAPTGIVGASLLFVGIQFFTRVGKSFDRISILKQYNTAAARSQLLNERIILCLTIAIGILAILSAIHFVLCALIEKNVSFDRANFGIVTVAFLSVYVVYLYFENSAPINSPGKILAEMAYLFAAAFFLFETRLSLGREKWRGYIAFGFIASLITAYSSIPTLIYYFSTGNNIIGTIYEMILGGALFIFITVRILLTGDLIEDAESPIANVFKMASEHRTAEIMPEIPKSDAVEGESESIDENQLTIDDVCATDSEISDETDASAEVEEQITAEDVTEASADQTTEAPLPTDEASEKEEDGQNAEADGNEEATIVNEEVTAASDGDTAESESEAEKTEEGNPEGDASDK